MSGPEIPETVVAQETPAAEPNTGEPTVEASEASEASGEGGEGGEVEAAEGESEAADAAPGEPGKRKRRRRGKGGGAAGPNANAGERQGGGNNEKPRDERRDGVGLELQKLVELATKYPEIGPPLAELAYKIEHPEVGDQVVRMGLDRSGEAGGLGLEYHLVTVNSARREGRWLDALAKIGEAAKAYAKADKHANGDEIRLLQLVRIGFNVVLFDAKDMSAAPVLAGPLAEVLPALEDKLGTDPLFHVLLAQTLWFSDRARAEAAWELACTQKDPELAWNARGTWAKEAEKDGMRAEGIYRRGLDVAPQSAILHHNLAQTLLDRAEAPDVDVEAARRLLREVDDHLRLALREEGPRGLRRHVHATRDRLFALRNSLPGGRHGGGNAGAPHQRRERAPEVEAQPPREFHPGDVVTGRVCSLAPYGAFVAIGGGMVGMVHKSELAHGPVGDVAQLLKIGDELEVKVLELTPQQGGRPRIALSRRALLPVPAGHVERPRQELRGGGGGGGGDRGNFNNNRGPGGPRGGNDRGHGGPPRRDRDQHPPPSGPPAGKFLAAGKVSLGELLLAKLKEQEGK